jgi:hypothetical protein
LTESAFFFFVHGEVYYLDSLVSSVEFLLVCGIADDQVIFPAVDGELSFCAGACRRKTTVK